MPERKITSRDALDQEHTHPSRARRALLTGGALSLAAVAGSALGGAEPASAATENVTALEPSGGDDTKAINTALSNAATPGGIVVLAGGTFTISSSIIPQGGVLLLGEKGTVIQAASGMAGHMISVSAKTPTPSTFACFTLDGGNGSSPWATGGPQAAFNGINIAAQLARFMIFDVTIQNISQDALSISGGSTGGSNVIGLQVLNAQRHGIVTSGASDLRFTNCEVDGVGQYSYWVGGTQQDFYNCKSNSSGMQGVTTVGNGSSGTTIVVNNVTSSYYPSSGILQIAHPVSGETSEFDVFQVPYGDVTMTGSDISAFTKCDIPSGYTPTNGDTVGLLQTAVDGSGTADAWHVTTGSVSIRATTQNDLYGNGIYVAADNCRIDVEAGNAGNALLVLDGASRNVIDMQVSKWGNYIGPPSNVYALNGTNTGNVSRIAGADPGASTPVYNTAYALLSGSTTEAGNYFDLECESTGALQNVTYATTIRPNPYLGGTINCDLAGDIVISNTADALSQPVGHVGSEMVISLKQPAAGGASVTWGSAYTASTPINTAANARTTWRFKCLSYSGGVPQWDEIG